MLCTVGCKRGGWVELSWQMASHRDYSAEWVRLVGVWDSLGFGYTYCIRHRIRDRLEVRGVWMIIQVSGVDAYAC